MTIILTGRCRSCCYTISKTLLLLLVLVLVHCCLQTCSSCSLLLFIAITCSSSSVVVVNGFEPSSIIILGSRRQRHHQYQQQHEAKARFKTVLSAIQNDDDDDDYDDDDDDDDYDDDDEPPDVGSVADFRQQQSQKKKNKNSPMISSFGYNRGRSSPSIRKAMGTSSTSTANVFVCTNCGGESVKWMGRCPTCREWNTLQEFKVPRSSSLSNNGGGGRGRAIFGGNSGGGGGGGRSSGSTFGGGGNRGSSWLDGVSNDYGDVHHRPVPVTQIDLKSKTSRRTMIPNDDEFSNVLGGGLMPGSLLLLGGDPGVGKSTLALQIAASLASQSKGIGMGSYDASIGPVWYVSGEETLTQVATRAERLDAIVPQLFLFAETNLNVVAEQVIVETEQAELSSASASASAATSVDDDDDDNDTFSTTTTTTNLPPSLIIVDSLQTMVCDTATSTNYASGGVAQARECMALLLRLAKVSQIPILVIGHVTKSGDVAGPRMVEHMVDAVLYLEHGGGSSSSSGTISKYRWLRAVKNRFGSCDIVGLYSFENDGRLYPSPELLDDADMLKSDDLEGCAMAVAVEGNQRAMVVEVQALVTTAAGMVGKKTVEGGISYARLSLLLGVLQKHCRVGIGKSRDVFLNVISNASSSSGSGSNRKGGDASVSLDLAVSIALTSSFVSIPVRGDMAFMAQVGLLGELRPLSNIDARLSQAQRLGFSQVVIAGKTFSQKQKYGMQVIECPTLERALSVGLTAGIPKRRQRRRSSNKKNAKNNEPSPEDNVIYDDDDYDDYE